MSARKTTLGNGLRVVTESIPWATSVSIGFWIGVGSRDEGPGEAGYAHMVEHMLFKGTDGRSARDIAEAMDRTGGHMNAFTTKETTCLHCRVLDEHMPMAMALLADMLLRSTFAPEDIARERAVILEEINQVEDAPEDLVHDLFDKQLFGDHPLAGPVLGDAATVARAERSDLLRFVGRHYRPDNVVLAVAGKVEHEEAVEMAERLLGSWRGSPEPAPTPGRRLQDVNYRADRVHFDKDGEQVHLCIGVPAFRRGDSHRYALDVLDAIFGGGMSSRLFQKLREDKGLVYSTYSFNAAYTDAGLFGGYAAAGPERAEQVLSLMQQEVAALGRGDIGEEEVARARQQIVGAVLLGWENVATRMGMMAGAELAGEPYLSATELGVRYKAVTLEDVKAVAARLLGEREMTVAVLGPGAKRRRPTRLVEAIG